MLNDIIRNWKTSGAGLCAAIGAIVAIFYPDKSGEINQIAAAVAVLMGTILALVAKDGDKSGTATDPNP